MTLTAHLSSIHNLKSTHIHGRYTNTSITYSQYSEEIAFEEWGIIC